LKTVLFITEKHSVALHYDQTKETYVVAYFWMIAANLAVVDDEFIIVLTRM